MERRLIEIVGAPPLEGHQLPHRGEVHLEHIAVEGYFPHIGPHVQNARLGHTLLDLPLLLRRHHDVEMDGASALFLSLHKIPLFGKSTLTVMLKWIIICL